MTTVSFGSTYKIPIKNLTPYKQTQLKKLAKGYHGSLYPSGKEGNVRCTMKRKADERFERILKQQLGVKEYKKFDRHSINETENKGSMDFYINEQIKLGNYMQFGKQKKKIKK